MATTNFREDFLGRDLLNVGTTATDYIGRLTTSTLDSTGRGLRRILRANTTAVTLNQEIAYVDGKKFIVTIAGTTAASEPGPPAVGATVADGTATILRQK